MTCKCLRADHNCQACAEELREGIVLLEVKLAEMPRVRPRDGAMSARIKQLAHQLEDQRQANAVLRMAQVVHP